MGEMVLEKRKEKKQAGFKKRAVRVGIGIGAIANVCYLYANHARQGIRGGISPPDPVWTQFINVALIFFAAIYTANLLGKSLERVLQAGRKVEKSDKRSEISRR